MSIIFRLFLCVIVACQLCANEEHERTSPSKPEQIATAALESSDLIGGVISPLSGLPVLYRNDLLAKGAQSISIERYYTSPFIPGAFHNYNRSQKEWDEYFLYFHLMECYKGWQLLPHLRLRVDPQFNDFFFTTREGITYQFALPSVNGSTSHLVSDVYGVSNVNGDEPSGKYEIRNTRFTFLNDSVHVFNPDGSLFIYNKKAINPALNNSIELYLLEKEVLPCGKVLRYYYNNVGPRARDHYYTRWELVRIESRDPHERFVYASIDISGSYWTEKCNMTTSCGKSAEYHYFRRFVSGRAYHPVKGGGDSKYTFFYMPAMTTVSTPIYRYEQSHHADNLLLTGHTSDEKNFNMTYTLVGGASGYYHVGQLNLPSNTSAWLINSYKMDYDPPIPGIKGGFTRVNLSTAVIKVFNFSKEILKTSVQYFRKSTLDQFFLEKTYSWNSNNWLSSVKLKGEKNQTVYERTYEYDSFGNPTKETITGNLTGTNDDESYSICKEYSQDNRNLLLKEEHDNGKVITYTYLPQTNLITSKLIGDKERVLLREFYSYDESHNLIKKIADDGSSVNSQDLTHVTARSITNYYLRDSAPFLHMPEWIEDKFCDKNDEYLLQKRHLIYDQFGNVIEEELFDANGAYAYSLKKTYNERGDLLTETNSLGYLAEYQYDAKGKLIVSTNFSKRLKTSYKYDEQNQVIEKKEEGESLPCHTTSYLRDVMGNVVEQKDHFNNITKYKYDYAVNKVIKTEYPQIPYYHEQDKLVASFSIRDEFGREKLNSDCNRNLKTYAYNAQGLTTSIDYPDCNSNELFKYKKDGKLSSHKDQSDLIIEYEHDILGNVISKLYVSSDGLAIAKEIFKYKGNNLIAKSDKEGNITEYYYDGGGRKIREQCYDRKIDYKYDSLGYLSEEVFHNKENTLVVHYKRDLEGRIVRKKKCDLQGNLLKDVSYQYDADNNQVAIVQEVNGVVSEELFEFDPFKRLIKHVDPLGYVTHKKYDESHVNALGQRVLQVITTNSQNVTSTETYDALNNLCENEVVDANNITITKQTYVHDGNGNVLTHNEHIYDSGLCTGLQSTQFTYNNKDFVESITEASQSPLAKQTNFKYYRSGKLKHKKMPDGSVINYAYDPLGFLKSVESSNGEIKHLFHHNKLGWLYRIEDEIKNIVIERKYDFFGNIIEEKFPFNLAVRKSYDHLNRLLSLEIPKYAKVVYNYDPLFLKEVQRVAKDGKVAYSHSYHDYDKSGNLLYESLIGNLGNINYQYDLLGRITQSDQPFFAQNYSYDSLGNLIRSVTNEKESSYQYDSLSQLTLEDDHNLVSSYAYDSIYNRTAKNGERYETNELNQLLVYKDTYCSYDLKGNLTSKTTTNDKVEFKYDPLNRLTEVVSKLNKIYFTYDPLGRCLSKESYEPGYWEGWSLKNKENYLYHDTHDIGAYLDSGKVQQFRVLGLERYKDFHSTVAIELNQKAFAPLLDIQGNIRYLVNIASGQTENKYAYTAFGESAGFVERDTFNPWRFASKRYISEYGIVNFGKRFYSPEFGRWLTTDPADFLDSYNLYQYALNNPYRYFDPKGENLLGFFCGVGQMLAGGFLLASIPVLEITTAGGFTFFMGFQAKAGAALLISGATQAAYNTKDISWSDFKALTTPIVLLKDIQSQSSVKEKSIRKRHNPNQEALSDLVKGSGKEGISNPDADILLDWAKEYDFPARDDRGKPKHWKGGEHIHLGPKHIKVNN